MADQPFRQEPRSYKINVMRRGTRFWERLPNSVYQQTARGAMTHEGPVECASRTCRRDGRLTCLRHCSSGERRQAIVRYFAAHIFNRTVGFTTLANAAQAPSETAVSTFKYKSLRETLRIEAIFSRPILEWERTSARFYSMIYEALAAKIPVNVGDFSVQPGTILSEVRARYGIYGGATSVTLHANKIVFDFPSLIPSDMPIVREVLSSVHDAFPKAFPELDYKTMEVQSYEHLARIIHGGVGFWEVSGD
jgi:hypothetical protein